MRIDVVTSLFPIPARPHEGVFAERRWAGMRARGHDVRVVHPLPLAPPLVGGAWGELRTAPRREQRSGLDVVRPRYLHLPGRARFGARQFARRALGLVLERRPDVVVADYAWPAAALAPALASRGLPFVVNGRGSDVLQVAGEAGLGEDLARYLRAASGWCAVSRDLVEAMDRLAGEARGRLVPNGVDAALFRPRDRSDARRELALPEDGPLVLLIGHLIERKDPLLALEAFRRLGREDARLLVAGRGPLEDELERRVAEAGLAERVLLVGELPPERLALVYAAGDVLLLTSRREGRPNVVLEALASGRPVVATRAGGTAELLTVEAERMLADGRDPAELARRLADLVDDPPPPELLASSVAPLDWETSLGMLEELLEELVSRPARSAGAR